MRIARPVLTALTLAMAMANSAHALDLYDAYSKAQVNDPRWSAARNNYLADDATTDVARAGLLPSLVANGDYSQNKFDSDAGTDSDYTGKSYGAKLTQPLFNANAWYSYQSAKAVGSQAEAAYRSAEQDLALRVSQAYFAVLSAQETLAYAEAEEAALARQLDQAQQRFDVGLIAITDVLEARASFDGSRANRIIAEANVSTSQETLATIIGEAPGKLAALKPDTPMVKPVPADPEAWVKLARERSPDIKAAEESYKSARAVTKQTRSGYLPTVDAYASYSDTNRDTTNLSLAAQNGSSSAYGLQANWAIFSGGGTYASSKQASYRAAAAQDNVIGTEKLVVNNTRTAFLNVSADSYRVDARKQAVASSESSLAATQAGYEVGTRNIVDVLLAQRNMYAAKRDYASARYDYVINTLQLKAASGQLSELDIKELNSWLDPNASVVSAPEKPAEELAPATAPKSVPKKK
ncbi:MAG: TolC family outer membrane protein [Moraxellaceae bacterium]